MNVNVLQAPPSASLSWTTVAAPEKEAEFLSFKLLNKRTRIRLSPQAFDLNVLDGKGTYFVAANTKGWFSAVARTTDGQSSLVFSPLNELRKAIVSSTTEGEENFEPKRILPLHAAPCHLTLALNDERLAVGLVDGSICVYDTATLFSPGNDSVPTLHTFPAAGPGPLKQLLGNPADLPELLAVRREASSGRDGLAVEIVDLQQLKSVGGWRATGGVIPTSINWSTKGKQLAIGLRSGDIVTFSPTSTDSPRLHVPRPACVGDSSILSVMWLSNTIFYGIYTPTGRTDPDAPQKHVTICFDPKATSATQTELETPYFASPALRPPGAFTVVMRNWDPLKIMVIVADSTSTDIGVVASVSENAAAEQWCNLTLEETSTPSVPLDKDADDTVPLGLEVDLALENENDKSSAPVLYVYASDGTIQAWSVSNSKGGPYSGMIMPSAQSQAATISASMATNAQATAVPATSAFSQPHAVTPAFGSSGFSASTPSFGKPSAPAFGSTGFSAFAQNQTAKTEPSSAQPSSAFGQTMNAPAFGQTSAFGQSTGTSVFGQISGSSAFGNSSGQSAFGQRPSNGFGAFASQGPSKFGQSSLGFGTPPPANQIVSASPATPATSATPAASTTPMVPATPTRAISPDSAPVDSPEAEMSDADISGDDTFGSLSLGGSKQVNKADSGAINSMFTMQTPTPAQKTATSAFASGESSFGSSQSSFGAFGSVQGSSFLKPASGFGVFSKTTDASQSKPGPAPTTSTAPAPTSAPAFGSSGFGKTAVNQPAFGQSSFGQSSFGQPSFGASTQFGKPSEFGKPSGFGSATNAAPGGSVGSAFSSYAGGSKGFGSFAQSGPSSFGQTQASQAKTTDASITSTNASKPAETSESSQKPSSTFGSPTSTPSASAPGTGVFGNTSKPSIFGNNASQGGSTSSSVFGPRPGASVFGAPGEAKSSFGVTASNSNVFGGSRFLSPESQKTGPATATSTTPVGSPVPTENPPSDANTEPAYITPTPSRFKSGSSGPFSVFANLPPTPPRPRPKDKDEAVDDGSGNEEGEVDEDDEDDEGEEDEEDEGDNVEDFLSDQLSEDADDAEHSEDEDAVGEEADEESSADEEEDDGEVIDAAEGTEDHGKAIPEEGHDKDDTAVPHEKAPGAQSTQSTTPAKTPPPLFGKPSIFGGSSVVTGEQSGASARSPSPGPAGKTATESEVKVPAVEESPPLSLSFESKSPSPASPFGLKATMPAGIGSTTPPASPEKEEETLAIQAPKPVPAAAQPPTSSPFGRQNTRPARSSPLVGSPVSSSVADSKSNDAANAESMKAKPASPRAPFGMVPASAPKPESTIPILPTAFGTPRQQGSPGPFNPQLGVTSSALSTSAPQPKPSVFRAPSLPTSSAVSGNATFIMPSSTPAGSPSLSFSPTGQASHPASSVPASTPATGRPTGLPPVPQITRAQEQLNFVSGMQKEFHTLCAAIAEDFEQLQKLSQVAVHTRTTLGRSSSSPHTRDDLRDRTKWSLGDLEAFNKMIKGIEKDILADYEANKELVPVAREIESNLLKAETRKEEIARFSKAKADPDFAKMLKARTLGPETAETQTQLRKQIRMMEHRVEQLESYLKAAKKKLDEHQRGKKGIRPPSLDTINRTYRNIDIAIKMQTNHIDELATRVAKLKVDVDDVDSVLHDSKSSSRRGSAELPGPLARQRRITEDENDRLRVPVSPSVAASTAAALNAERNALRLKNALFKARKEPLLNRQAIDAAASRVPTLENMRKATGPDGSKPWLGSLDIATEYVHDVEPQRRTRSTKHDKPVKLGRTHHRVPSDIKTFDWGPLPSAKPITSLPVDILGYKPS